MSEFAATAQRTEGMAKALPRTSDDLLELRRNLAARLRGMGTPPEDVDDVVDRALEKAAAERNPDPTLTFGRRAGVALKDARAEYYRRREARPEIEPEAGVPDAASTVGVDGSVDFRRGVRALRAELGDDAAKFLVMTCIGLSERAIGECLGWDRLKTQRVRRRLERNAPAILRPYFDFVPQKEAS